MVKMMTLSSYFATYIGRLAYGGKEKTALNYRSTWNMVSRYLGWKAAGFLLTEITDEWVHRYSEWLAAHEHLKPGSIDFYIRNLSALYGHAVREKLVDNNGRNPFRGIRPAVPVTAKRALADEDIRKLIAYTGSGSSRRSGIQARDVFLFLFYTRGMCFVDVFNLRKSDIYGVYIYYKRSKTGAALQVKIIPEVKKLIEKYSTPESEYIFPFLHQKLRGSGEVNEHSVLRRLNRNLAAIGKELGITLTLTTYVARHTWASLTEACGTNTSIISQGLGHSSERVTRIYMKGMPSHVIDNANEEMLNRLVRRKKKKRKDKNKKCLFLCKKGTSYRIRL